MADLRVTGNADGQGDSQDAQGHAEVEEDTPKEYRVRGEGLAVMFERHPWFVARLAGEAKKQEGGMPKISEKVDENSGHRLQTAGCRKAFRGLGVSDGG